MRFLTMSVFVSFLGTWFTYMLFIVQIFNKTGDERLTMIIVGAQAIAMLIGGQVVKYSPRFSLTARNPPPGGSMKMLFHSK